LCKWQCLTTNILPLLKDRKTKLCDKKIELTKESVCCDVKDRETKKLIIRNKQIR
jgi:hypothetical protein